MSSPEQSLSVSIPATSLFSSEFAPAVFEGDVPMDRLANLLAFQFQFSAEAARLGGLAWYQERAGVATCTLEQAADLRVLTVAHCMRVRPFDQLGANQMARLVVAGGMARDREAVTDVGNAWNRARRNALMAELPGRIGEAYIEHEYGHLDGVAAADEAAELERADGRRPHPLFMFLLGSLATLLLLATLAVA